MGPERGEPQEIRTEPSPETNTEGSQDFQETVHATDTKTIVDAAKAIIVAGHASDQDPALTTIIHEVQTRLEGETRGRVEVQRIAPGVTRVERAVDFAKGTVLDAPATYVVEGKHGVFVIDPGGEFNPVSLGMPKVKTVREEISETRKPIEAVLLTHGDPDHTNNYEDIAPTGTPIFVGRQGRWSVLSPERYFLGMQRIAEKGLKLASKEPLHPDEYEDPGDLTLRDFGLREILSRVRNPRDSRRDFLLREVSAHLFNPNGLPALDAAATAARQTRKRALETSLRDMPDSFETEHGRMEVIALPGHAREEVGFCFPQERIMIGGDLLTMSPIERSKRMDMFMPVANVYDAVSSLEKIQSLNLEAYYPAHGKPLIGAERVANHLNAMITDAKALIAHIQEVASAHPRLSTKELRPLVFTPEWEVKRSNKREQESWILSTLRDRAK